MTAAPLPRLDPSLLDRPRLRDAGAPVTIIRAPSGAGKAVLALQWAHAACLRGEEVWWFDGRYATSVDVLRSLRQLLADLPEVDDQAAADSFDITVLWNLARQVTRDCVIVINNLERLDDDLAMVVAELVRSTSRVRCILVTRTLPSSTWEVQLAFQVLQLRTADLLFTAEECRQHAAVIGQALDEVEAEEVMAMTGGWPALVQIGWPGRELDTTGRSAAQWSAQRVREFVRERVLGPFDASSRGELVQLAMLEHLTAESAQCLGLPSSPDALAAMESIGIMDRETGGALPVFRMPDPVRQVLLAELGRGEVRIDVDDLHDRAVKCFLALGEHQHALRQAVAGRRWEHAATVIDDHVWELLSRHPELIAAALHRIPRPLLRSYPVAAAAQALIEDQAIQRSAAGPATSPETTPETSSEPSPGPVPLEREDPARTLDRLSLSCVLLRRRGQLDQAIAVREHAPATLTEAPVVSAPLAINAAVALCWSGSIHEAVFALDAVRDSVAGIDDDLASEATVLSALCCALLGEVTSARSRLSRADARTRAGRGAASLLDLDRVRSIIDQVLATDTARADAVPQWQHDGSGSDSRSELWAVGLWADLDRALISGDAGETLARVRAMRRVPAGGASDRFFRNALVAAEAEVLMAMGRGTEVATLLSRIDPTDPSGTVGRARLALLEGRLLPAAVLAGAVTRSDVATPRLRCRAVLIAAAASEGRGEHGACRMLLASAVRLANRCGLVSVLATVPRRLLTTYVDEVDGLSDLIEQLDQAGVGDIYPESLSAVRLTSREAVVLEQLAQGGTTAQIAAALFVSRNTVKSQVQALYRKLGVSTREEAVARAQEVGL